MTAGPGAIALPLAALLWVAGCGLHPPAGVHGAGKVPGDASGVDDLRVLPFGPQPDDTPELTVAGFLLAQATSLDVAREYLAPGTVWRPDAATYVDASRPTTQARSGSALTVSENRVASLGTDGAYQPEDGNGRTTLAFGVTRVDGQWRLSRVPDGLRLTTADLARDFRGVNLYFLPKAPGAHVLVADPVFLRVTRPQLADAVLAALLHGVTNDLAPAVTTAIPVSAAPAGPVAIGADGVASVPLSADPAQVSTSQVLLDVAAQVRATLGQVPGVRSVQVVLNGHVLPVSDPSLGGHPTAVAPTDPSRPRGRRAYVVIHGHLVDLNGGGPALPLTTGLLAGVVASTGMVGGLLSAGGSDPLTRIVTQVTADQVCPAGGGRLRTSKSPSELCPRTDPADWSVPAWDPLTGRLLAVRNGAAPALLSVAARPAEAGASRGSGSSSGPDSEAPVTISAPGLRGIGPVAAVAVAPDGVRIALVAGSPGRRSLWVGLLTGQQRGQLSGLRNVGGGLATVAAVSWLGSATLTVLGTETGSGATLLPYAVAVDGSSLTPLAKFSFPPACPRAGIAAAVGQDLLTSCGGRLYRLPDAASNWETDDAGSAPTYAG